MFPFSLGVTDGFLPPMCSSTPLVSTATNATNCRWINADDLQARCNNHATAKNENNPCVSLMVDAVAYNQDDLSPTNFRLRSETDADAAADILVEAGQTATSTSDSVADGPFLRNADYATEATLRWCNDFVAELNLCPWAKLSLAEQNAIRVKIIDQSLGIDSFEQIVRDSGEELLRLTGHDEYSSNSGETEEGNGVQTIDPNIAITFIVALPPLDCIDQEGLHLPDFGFASFHDFVFDLEDRLFAEADAFAEAAEQQNNQDGTITDSAQAAPIGDWITVAPFHPAWSFEGEANSPVAWEKRTPFPTVSIVRSDAIEAAGEEATARIAQHNEEILNDVGSHALRDLFRRAVLQKNV